MDGLSSIRPEIESFVSRENRSHADPWLQQVKWVQNDRTLTLYVRKPPTDGCHGTVDADGEKLLATLTPPSLLRIYFPCSLDEKPFCFCEDDALVPAIEAANGRLRPLSCNSILAVVTVVLQCVKREPPDSQTNATTDESVMAHSFSGGTALKAVNFAAEAVLTSIKEDPLSADLALALLSMAISSYRRDTVSTPFPKQLESKGCKRAYVAFVSSLEGIPGMMEISKWADAKQLLLLPPVALLALHFVLVFLPTNLRTSKKSNTSRDTSAALNDSSAFNGDRLSDTAAVNCTRSPLPAEAHNAANSAGCGPGKDEGCFGRGGLPDAAENVGVANGNVENTRLGSVPSHVFDVVLPNDPTFDAEAKRAGSSVAYHGSSPENFHSILNTGLRVMSGSRLMKNGAAFGDGIYLSGSCWAAAAFAQRGDGSGTTIWPKSAFGDDNKYTTKNEKTPVASAPKKFRYRLVAKCRVLKGDGVKEVEGWGGEESYFVVSNESRIRVEGLFLFHEGQNLPKNLPQRSQHQVATVAPKRGDDAISNVGDKTRKGAATRGGGRAAGNENFVGEAAEKNLNREHKDGGSGSVIDESHQGFFSSLKLMRNGVPKFLFVLLCLSVVGRYFS